ncbi:MAG: carnitine dehydratase [Gammaproteobacteria bacterium]|nr:carnitine dehydratase [Gammaproteobacteria bacterium]
MNEETNLKGITVVALEQAVAAPYASGRLAEEGARVIKIERPEGDFARHYDKAVKNQSAYFVWLNAGKESISLNLKTSEDRQIIERMLKKADVFIQNLSPKALDRLNLDLEGQRKSNPGLITCSINGYGSEGLYKDKKAYDLLVQAESGLCSVTGIGEQLTRVGVSVSDIAAGMNAYQEILLALFRRERDPQKKGSGINVSLFHSTTDWMNVPYLQYKYGNESPVNQGLSHPTIAPYGAYKCKNGQDILFSIQNDREWRNFCEAVMEKPSLKTRKEFSNNTERVRNRKELDRIISDAFFLCDPETIISRLDSAGIAFGRLNDVSELDQHPQIRFRNIATSQGKITMLGRGATKENYPKEHLKIPEINEHGKRLRDEFGQ